MELFKKIGRPIWRPLYGFAEKKKVEFRTFHVPLESLLRGGENGIRAAKYAELTQDFLRPSTSVFEGPHVQLLQQYEVMGEEVLSQGVFEKTAYYKNAYECMRLTGAYFYDRPEKIKELARRLIAQYTGKQGNYDRQPGQSDINQPIWVRPIRYSSCYEVIDGNHRIARAIMRGDKTIPALVYEKEPVMTPLQQLLLDCLWINKQKWLYQPLDFPELRDQWPLVRKCSDRFDMMRNFLEQEEMSEWKKNYLDIGSSYGWFVSAFGQMGFSAHGLERDPFGMDIGFKVYGLKPTQIFHQDIVFGLTDLVQQKKTFSVVSCLSVLHHFVLNKSSTSAEMLIQLIDQVTDKVLFFDTGEEHEAAFRGTLSGWNPEFIKAWLLKNTRFKQIISLGVDGDRKYPFEGYYRRTLFACVK
jgi:hypothetical protein